MIELLRGLSSSFEIVLVTPDTPETLRSSPAAQWVSDLVTWNPENPTRESGKRLAEDLSRRGVQLAHFHGGTYAFGARRFGVCPVIATKERGIKVVTTNHLVHPPLEGYCGPFRSIWLKLALFPFAWASRLHVLAHTDVEFTVSKRDCAMDKRIFWPLAGKIQQMYHSKLDENEVPPEEKAGNRKSEIGDQKSDVGCQKSDVRELKSDASPQPSDLSSQVSSSSGLRLQVSYSRRLPTIICVGTIGERKGQHILVEAFDRIADEFPEWRLRLIGRVAQPRYYAVVEKALIAAKHRDRIEVAGCLPEEEVVRAMYESAIFAFPSFSEGLGLALQEAMFRGCACIGSDVGGIPDLIQDGETGILVPPGDVARLAAGLIKLLDNEQVRLDFARQSKNFVLANSMSAYRMVELHREMYLRCCRHQRAI